MINIVTDAELIAELERRGYRVVKSKPLPPGLTKQQATAYQFIRSRILEGGYSPSYREIGRAINVKSVSNAHRVVEALIRRGMIRKTLPHGWHSLTIQED